MDWTDADRTAAVVAAIEGNRNGALDLLRRLTRAAQDGEAAMQAIVAESFAALGYDVDVFEADLTALRQHPEYTLVPELATIGTKGRPNVVARLPRAGSGGRALFAFAHIDSYVLDPTGWRFNPYDATGTESGRVYGYGIADDRSGVATMILAAQALATAGVQLSGDVVMASCLGKHLGAGGTLAVVERGYGGDGAVYLHPAETGRGLSEFKAVALGLAQFEVTVNGQAPEYPEQSQTPAAHRGVNAIEKAGRLICDLRAWAERLPERWSHPAVDAALGRSANLNVAQIRGGHADRQVPVRCTFTGSITFPPGPSIVEVRAAFEAAVAQSARADSWLAVHPPRVDWQPMWANPCGSEVNGEFVRAFQGCVQTVTGTEPVVWPGHLASDIRYPLLYANAQTVGFGPRAGNFGGPDEWLDVHEFLNTAKCLGLLIVRWCGLFDPTETDCGGKASQ